MQLICEENFPELHDVDAQTIAETLDSDCFGKFAILSRSEEDFIQAGSNWSPTDECRQFLKDNGSDPWILEYRDPSAGRILRASGDVTLEQVKQAFLAYHRGASDWKSNFRWEEQP